MIDMHMHTVYSDGDKTVEEVLKMCEERKLEYISITDHDTCSQYDDELLKNNNIFSGKIIKGTELHAVFQDKSIEILAYNINTNIISEWREKYYSEEQLKEQQIICYKRLLKICDKHGLIYDESKIIQPNDPYKYVERPIYEELMSHEENYKKLGEFTESFSIFFRKGLANPESSYFMNHVEFRPPYKEVIDIKSKFNITKRHNFVGGLLIIFGVYILLNSVIADLAYDIPYLRVFARLLTNYLPPIIIATICIMVGIKFISKRGEK